MNKLKLKGLAQVQGMKFNHIEGGFGEGKKAILVKDIAEIHKREVREINQAINMNRTRFKNYIDIVDLKGTIFAINLIDNGIYTQNSMNASRNIYLLSERGYSKLLKILEDDFAWEQYEQLVDHYFNMRENQNQRDLSNLSPQLQLLINMELKQKEMEVAIAETKEEVQAIKDVIVINPGAEWRKKTNRVLNNVGWKLEDYQKPKNEAYEALRQRANCRPNVLIGNLKKRALANGMAPSKVENLNLLDVLENDARLREIYVTIVKEMAIRYGVA